MSNLIKHHFTSRFKNKGVILNFDWKALEICGWAYLTQDPVLLDLLQTGKDMHKEVGGMVLGCKPEEVTKEQRSALKPANFTLIYGGTDWNLVQKDGLDEQFAKQVYDGFWTLFKRARVWSDEKMLELDKNAEYTTQFSKDGYRELWSWYKGPTGRKFWFKAYEDKISAFCAENRIYTARGFKYSEGMNYQTQSLCVDKETEYLTPTGWKKISNYSRDDKIAVYDELGYLHFEQPAAYIFNPEDEFIEFNKTTLNHKMTKQHRMIYETEKHNKLGEKTAEDMAKIISSSKAGFSGKVISTFINGNEEQFDPVLTRLLIAYQADGTLIESVSTGKRTKVINLPHKFHFSKQHKIDRLKKLLGMMGLEFKEYSHKGGTTGIATNIPYASLMGKSKDLLKIFSFADISVNQAEIIAEEAQLWDGNDGHYFTANKQNADFIQYCFNLSGSHSNITEQNKRDINHSTIYTVTKYKEKTISYKNTKLTYQAEKEPSYCFTTRTGMWLARRNGKIFVTGNCTADIHMFALGILFREAMKHRDKFLLINTVHDSVMIDCKLDFLDTCVKLVKDSMESVVGRMKEKFNMNLNIDFIVECEYGKSWGEMQDYKFTNLEVK